MFLKNDLIIIRFLNEKQKTKIGILHSKKQKKNNNKIKHLWNRLSHLQFFFLISLKYLFQLSIHKKIKSFMFYCTYTFNFINTPWIKIQEKPSTLPEPCPWPYNKKKKKTRLITRINREIIQLVNQKK